MEWSSQASDENLDWDRIITPNKPWWDFRLRELAQYRDLIWMLVRRNFLTTYKQTILGPVWYFLNPIISSVVFTIVFGTIAGLSTDNLPPFLFYFSGNVIWNFFTNILQGTSNTLVSNQYLYQKVYFPRLIMPITGAISNLIQFGIRFILFGGFLLYFIWQGFPVHPNIWAWLTPVLVLLMAGHGLGWGIIIASLTIRYRDLQQMVRFGVYILMYLTPILYPASMVPENLKPLYFLNPISPIVEAFRFGFLGESTLDVGWLLYSVVFLFISLFIGLVLFNRVEQNFVDSV